MKLSLIASILLASVIASANDGGIAAIEVKQIKMQEKNHSGEIVRRISEPHFTITVKGGEAKKLQQILPSMVSVVTSMDPSIKDAYNESFKSLGIYSKTADGVKGKSISIDCSDARLKHDENFENFQVEKLAETTCTISINRAEDGYETDAFGDAQEFNPGVCK